MICPVVLVVAHLVSIHTANNDHHNNRNWGAGIECRLTEAWSGHIGSYYNSERRETVYAMIGYTPLRIGPVRIGGVAGYVSGYNFTVPMMAGITASVSLGGPIEAGLIVVPKIGNNDGVFHLTVDWRF